MKYKFIDPETIQAAAATPSKDALLTQIEADHYAATRAGDKEAAKRLDARYKDVESAKSDGAARKAYEAALEQEAERLATEQEAAAAEASTTEEKS